MKSRVYNCSTVANLPDSERAASLADALFCASACICISVYAHMCQYIGGESDTVSLPGWQAALSASSEWKPIWQITSSRQSAHPPLFWPPLAALSNSLLVLFVWHLSLVSLLPPPQASLTLAAALPHTHTHIYKKHALPRNLGPPFLFAWQKRRITVIDFHVAGTPGKLFEGLCCDEYQIWDQRRGEEKKTGWEGEKKKKGKQKKMLTLFSGPVSWLLLSVTLLLSSLSLSFPLFIFTPWHAVLFPLPPFPILSFFIHIHLSPLPWLPPPCLITCFLSRAFYLCDDRECDGLILLNKDQ